MSQQAVLNAPELRQRGFQVLVSALGWVNAARFIQQYESSSLDYVREREQILPDWDADTLLSKSHERAQPN